MTPLLIFLLACVAIYLGTIEAAFSALMRLSLRLLAERSDRPGTLGTFLDNLSSSARSRAVLAGVVIATATALLARAIGVDAAHTVTVVVLSVVTFVVVCELAGAGSDRVSQSRAGARARCFRRSHRQPRALRPISKWIGARGRPHQAGAAGSVPAPDVAAEEAKGGTEGVRRRHATRRPD